LAIGTVALATATTWTAPQQLSPARIITGQLEATD